MKNLLKFCVIGILAIFIQNCYAQKTDTTKNKSQELYIIDGKAVSENEFNKLKSTDIFEVTILNDSTAAALDDRSYPNGTMLITTKDGAKKLYQQKLSAFSKKYKAYMDAKGDDNKLLYVIDNTMLIAGANKSLRELSDLKPEDIKDVNFKKDSRYVSDATVVITTKGDAE